MQINPHYIDALASALDLNPKMCKYVFSSGKGYEVLSTTDPESHLITSGFLQCKSLTMHFPDISGALMTHHCSRILNRANDALDEILYSIAFEYENLLIEKSEYSYFNGTADKDLIHRIITNYFPHASPSRYQKDSQFTYATDTDIIGINKNDGMILKKIDPRYIALIAQLYFPKLNRT